MYADKIFSKQRVRLDGNTFDHCIFEDCTLVYEGGAFEIRGGFKAVGSVDLDLSGAGDVEQLLNLFGRTFGFIPVGGRTYVADEDDD